MEHKKPHILILNGPNLNLLGKREPEIYGSISFEQFYDDLQQRRQDCLLAYFQSNHEGDIIDKLHQVGFDIDGIILNAGAYTHTSIAIADAVSAITAPVIEVHISDLSKRESFRQISYLTANCVKYITGKGLSGYEEGLDFLINAYK